MANPEASPIVLQMRPVFEMSDEQFFQFCQLNRDYRIERNAAGEMIIMSPTGSETGNRNFKLAQQLANWTDQDGTGIGFDSSSGFKLPSGADRSPDIAWMTLEKWSRIPPDQQTKFAPVCPDFVVEIRSPSDTIKPIQEKLQEYIDNGASLGWLVDRKNRTVYVYRPDTAVECLDNPETVGGDPILPGFSLKMEKIW
ncbi:MAG: Uma2 family endonuclease [Microcoleaceae cyanobacterium]